MNDSILALGHAELTQLMKEYGQSAFRATQLMEWLWKHTVTSFDQMSNIAPALREKLAERFCIRPLELVEVNESAGGTKKFLSRMQDGHLVESVIIPAAVGKDGEHSSRITLCVSSQVGCAFGCKFCASGLLGLTRNLTAGEILGQILLAQDIAQDRVDNLVFMGMGEPLANMRNLSVALNLIMDHRGLNIGARHITISTSGHVKGLKALAALGKPIRLAVSLHGASNEVRSQIMPVNKTWPIEELVEALQEWQQHSRHMITLEYILIEGVNNELSEARKLINIAKMLRAKVNLIPYNTVEGLPWQRPTEERCKAFARALIANKIPVTMRYEKGHDINAACGQLRMHRKQEEEQV